jgi:hypothetical protein
MRTWALHRSLVGIIGFAALFVLAPSAVWPAAPSTAAKRRPPVITIKPATNLHNRQKVKVAGSHFPRKYSLVVIECNPKVQTNDPGACDTATLRSITTNRRGSFSMRFKVVTGKVGDGRCGTSRKTDRCYVYVSQPSLSSSVHADKTIRFSLKK